MTLEYSLEEMVVVKAPPAVLDEAAAAEGLFWGGRVVGYPLKNVNELLVRPIGRRPKRWGSSHGPVEKVEEHLREDSRVENFRRVYVVMVPERLQTATMKNAPPLRPPRRRGGSLTGEQEMVLSRDSLHGKWDCGHHACFLYPSEEAATNALREAGATNTVLNDAGGEVDFETALEAMDPDLIDEIHEKIGNMTKQDFFEEYCEAHRDKYDEEFALNVAEYVTE